LQVGKTNGGWVKDGISEYLARLSNYIPFEVKDLEINSLKFKAKDLLMLEESKKILGAIKPGDYVVLLDEGGKLYNSEDFAVWVNKKFAGISNDLVFVIGGAYGFHDDVKTRSNEKISMSPMTFTHQMIRLIFVEQLYRAMTILKNEPYHHS
jgi:23S rRNA (pseudouridine1915-N3)-methyltransferase